MSNKFAKVVCYLMFCFLLSGGMYGQEGNQRRTQQRQTQQRQTQQRKRPNNRAAQKDTAKPVEAEPEDDEFIESLPATPPSVFIDREVTSVNLLTNNQVIQAVTLDVGALFLGLSVPATSYNPLASNSSRYAVGLAYERAIGSVRISLKPSFLLNTDLGGLEYWGGSIGAHYTFNSFSSGVGGLGGYFVGATFSFFQPSSTCLYTLESTGETVCGQTGLSGNTGGSIETGYTLIFKNGLLLRPYGSLELGTTLATLVTHLDSIVLNQRLSGSSTFVVGFKAGIDVGFAF